MKWSTSCTITLFSILTRVFSQVAVSYESTLLNRKRDQQTLVLGPTEPVCTCLTVTLEPSLIRWTTVWESEDWLQRNAKPVGPTGVGSNMAANGPPEGGEDEDGEGQDEEGEANAMEE